MRDHITIGVVVARRALKGPWASQAWLPVAVLPAAPDAAGRHAARPRRRRRDLLCGRGRDRALRPGDRALPRQPHGGAALGLGGAAPGRRRGRARLRDGRPLRGRGAGGEHRRRRRGGPDAGRPAGPAQGLLRRPPRGARLPQARSATGPTRRRSAAAGRPAAGGRRMSGDFLSRWSRRKLEPPGGAARSARRQPQPGRAGGPPSRTSPRRRSRRCRSPTS